MSGALTHPIAYTVGMVEGGGTTILFLCKFLFRLFFHSNSSLSAVKHSKRLSNSPPKEITIKLTNSSGTFTAAIMPDSVLPVKLLHPVSDK